MEPADKSPHPTPTKANIMAKAPLVSVKEGFESKEKLVDAVQKLATGDLWIDRVSTRKGLAHVSNAKLLRLHAVLSDAKQRFGSREKLVGAILELAKRLDRYPLPQLLDLHRSLTKSSKRATAKADGAPKAKKAAAPKAEAAPKKAAPKAEKAPAKKAPAKKK
jgi:hypothetical protein